MLKEAADSIVKQRQGQGMDERERAAGLGESTLRRICRRHQLERRRRK